MKNLANMMKQAQELQARMATMQDELAAREETGQAGGGMVTVTLNGRHELRRLVIDPSLIEAKDKEMIEDLIIAAHADARAKIEAAQADEMSKLTSGLPLPPGMKLPF